MDEPELVALRRHERNRRVGLALGAVAVIAGLVASWRVLRPTSCDALRAELCSYSSAGCGRLEELSSGWEDRWCAESLAVLKASPPSMRAEVVVKIFEDLSPALAAVGRLPVERRVEVLRLLNGTSAERAQAEAILRSTGHEPTDAGR